MKEQFDETYFKTLNYTNYLERSDRYIKLAEEIISLLEMLNLIDKNNKILDYGCSVGFLLDGFKHIGYDNISGYDISHWATNKCTAKGHHLHDSSEQQEFDIITALDVLEHMTDEEILTALSRFKSNILLVRIPCSVDGKNFYLDISKIDSTHCNCKLKSQWKSLFKELGYNFFLPINMNTIFDSDGVMCYLCFKESL